MNYWKSEGIQARIDFEDKHSTVHKPAPPTTSANFWRAFRETLLACGWDPRVANHADHVETLRVESGHYK